MKIVERRYQYRSRDGIKWTDWFTNRKFDQDDDAEKYYKNIIKQKEADKKLLGEYRLV